MLNAVLIGFGYWGPNIARNLKASKDFELCGICDVDQKKLEKARNIYGDSICYYSAVSYTHLICRRLNRKYYRSIRNF